MVERKFGVLNEKIHFCPGAMPEAPRRDEQHPSNKAEFDYDDLMQTVITEIIHHNQSADRAKRRNFFAIANNTGITPQDIYESSILEFPERMRKLSLDDEAKVRWAFMPEERASVRKDCVYFQGVEYHHPYFKQAGFYAKARHQGAFKIIVKSVRDWVNYIWHKNDTGDYIRLDAKNINNANPLLCQHWEPVLHVLKQEAELQHKNKCNALISRIYWDSVNETARTEKRKQSGFIKPNRNKAIQTGIKERKEIQKKIQTVENVIGFSKMLSKPEIENTSLEHLDENDDELYGD